MKTRRLALLLLVFSTVLLWVTVGLGNVTLWPSAAAGAAYATRGDFPSPMSITVSDATCASIQGDIDALPPAGGRVLLPAGEYTCDTAVVIAGDHVELRGWVTLWFLL